MTPEEWMLENDKPNSDGAFRLEGTPRPMYAIDEVTMYCETEHGRIVRVLHVPRMKPIRTVTVEQMTFEGERVEAEYELFSNVYPRGAA